VWSRAVYRGGRARGRNVPRIGSVDVPRRRTPSTFPAPPCLRQPASSAATWSWYVRIVLSWPNT
jgi:hypothetical protein